MSSYYRWNVELISNLAGKVEGEISDLRNDSTNLERLKQDVEGAWQSVSGTEYTGSLEVNKSEIDAIITEAEEMKRDLDRAAKIYSQAESEIRNIIGNMSGRMQH